jgi:hypothetical protein
MCPTTISNDCGRGGGRRINGVAEGLGRGWGRGVDISLTLNNHSDTVSYRTRQGHVRLYQAHQAIRLLNFFRSSPPIDPDLLLELTSC